MRLVAGYESVCLDMSFAADLSPTGEMRSSVVILLNILIEFAIFVASELFLRSFSVSNGSSERKKLLLLQGVTLLVFSGFLLVFHHVPYALIITALVIFVRVVWFKRGTMAMYNNPNVVVSQPIGSSTRQASGHRWKEQWPQENYSQMNSAASEEQLSGHHHHPIHTESTGKKQMGTIPMKRSYSTSLDLRRRPGIGFGADGNAAGVGELKPLRETGLSRDKPPFPHVHTPQMETSSYISASQMKASNSTGEIPSVAPPGLVNLGNTCFINSVLHCLAWTPKFLDLQCQLSDKQVHDKNLMHFIVCLSDVLSRCQVLPDGRTALNSVDTNELLTAISEIPQHLVSVCREDQCQQDAAEFLLWLLNSLHSTWRLATVSSKDMNSATYKARQKNLNNSIKKWEREITKIGSHDMEKLKGPMWNLSKEALELHSIEHSSIVNDSFMGQFLEVRQCRTCFRITTSSEYFTILPLPVVDDSNHIIDCIQHFSSPERLAVDNKIACACSPDGSTAERLTLLSVLPDVLVLQLSRFSYDKASQSAVKNTKHIYFDVTLDIYRYTMQCKFDSNSSSLLYDLQAVCLHSGGQWTSRGHYVAYVKASNDQWYFYNDDKVYETDIAIELRSQFLLENSYLLFYSKR